MTRIPNRRLLALALATAMTSAPAIPALAQSADPFSLGGSAPNAPGPGSFTVSDIRIDGLQRISAGTVFTYLPVERGDTMDTAKAGDAIRALYKTGFFEDVQLDRQGNILVVTVTERPAINKLTLTGNKDIKSEDLLKGLKEIGLAEGDTFDRLALDKVTQDLARQYNNRGKYNVEITPSVNRLDRNRVDITINVKEGKAAKIRHINLIGNDKFEQKDIVNGWESREHNWLSWYRRDDQYSREKLSGDLEKLNSYYLDRGYVDFSIDSTQVSISPDRQDMFLSAGITEGEQYKVASVQVTGDTVLPKDQIEKLVIVKPEQIFSRRLLEVSSESITAALGNVGYAFAQVNPIPDVNRENKTVGINMQVVPGPRVNVRRVVFKGNTRTGDEVLRREMRQFEGTWYSQAAIDRSKIRLQGLGYFETVDVESKPVPGTNDQVDIVYNLKETTSGSFVFGLGYSQLGKLTTQVQLSQNNFLGSGNRVSVQAQRSYYQSRYDFSYTNPYFTDDGVSLGYNLSWRELDYSDFNTAQYSTTSGTGQVVLGIPLTETDSVTGLIGIDSNEILAFEGTAPESIIDYLDALGQRTFHAWRAQIGWGRNSLNHALTPTAGTQQRIWLEATLPGSTVEYYKINYNFSKFWPLSRHLVLNTRAELGYGDSYGKDVSRVIDRDGPNGPLPPKVITASGLPFFENFYAGGVRSVRGFTDNTLGPRQAATATSTFAQPLGGAFKTTGSLEMYFPTLLDTPAARVSAFLDFGNVYKDYDAFDAGELRASAGIALMWRSPMGPISISYAFPFKKQGPIYSADGATKLDRGDELERLQFTFGGTF
ncbi:outer membrane protein assembly factor BamA [Lysobacter capsici]|uniref:outer membrane protein assembly factor BamA n=1 Tax=Lysobacter capsici TaxID=435897 RepID=UPI001C005744|nr:outer membrane protein assembly factor BamA [Lysobacter capsici]MBW8807870.1 outer membrane protein assembly factor BamA [Lysobacter sp.]QWF18760.1 outer membrane protein assembly factor BamA [Lysobacter capsici]